MLKSQDELYRQWRAQRRPQSRGVEHGGFDGELKALLDGLEAIAGGINGVLPRHPEPSDSELRAAHRMTLQFLARERVREQRDADETVELAYQNWRRLVLRNVCH